MERAAEVFTSITDITFIIYFCLLFIYLYIFITGTFITGIYIYLIYYYFLFTGILIIHNNYRYQLFYLLRQASGPRRCRRRAPYTVDILSKHINRWK